jgi:hypothetical protein
MGSAHKLTAAPNDPCVRACVPGKLIASPSQDGVSEGGREGGSMRLWRPPLPHTGARSRYCHGIQLLPLLLLHSLGGGGELGYGTGS